MTEGGGIVKKAGQVIGAVRNNKCIIQAHCIRDSHVQGESVDQQLDRGLNKLNFTVLLYWGKKSIQ